jgi:hypothetical protein
MDLAALKAELAGAAYQGLSDAAAAASLNAQVVDGSRDFAIADLVAVMARLDKLAPLGALAREAATQVPAHDAAVAAAASLLELARQPQLTSFPGAQRGRFVGWVDALRVHGALTALERLVFLGLVDGKVSRAEQLGLGAVSHLDVAAARALA